MTRSRRIATPRLVLLAAWTLYAGSYVPSIVVPQLYRTPQPLEPYLTVVTDVPHEEAAQRLLGTGALGVITPQSTEVFVSRFSRLDRIPLPVALATLDPLDPRRDPWMEQLSSYFTVYGRNVVYARFDLSPLGADRLVRHVLGRDARIAEASLFRMVAALLVFLLIATTTLVFAGAGRLRMLPAVVAWLPAVAAGGLVAAAAAAAAVIIVAWAAEEFARVWTMRRQGVRVTLRTLGVRCAILCGALALSLVYAARLGGPLSTVPLAIAALGSVLGAALGSVTLRSPLEPDHRPFIPLSIVATRLGNLVGRRWSRLGLLALPVLLLTPLVADAFTPGGGISRPVPRASEVRSLDYEAIRTVWRLSGDGGLPDVSDYLAHRAYQEGFLYGRAYAFPASDETIELRRYREEPDGSYSSYLEPVMTFDERWVDRAIADAPAGVASMLVGLGYATGVVLSPVDTIYSSYSQFLQHLTYVVLVLAPFLFAAIPWARPIRTRGSVIELSRRRRQVA